jgi:hypothetical protein
LAEGIRDERNDGLAVGGRFGEAEGMADVTFKGRVVRTSDGWIFETGAFDGKIVGLKEVFSVGVIVELDKNFTVGRTDLFAVGR